MKPGPARPLRSAGFGVALLALAMLLARPAEASLFSAINGVADVAQVWSEVNGQDQETLRQQYTANFGKALTSYIDLRTSFRYYRFDLDEAGALGSTREEVQPSAELAWTHPWFRFLGTVQRREVKAPFVSGELITESLLLDWRTTSQTWPIFNLRYDWQQIEDTGELSQQSTRQRVLLAGLSWTRLRENYQYTFTRRENDNLVRDLKGTEDSHLFRYSGLHDLDESRRWRLDSQYVFGYRSRVDEIRTGDIILQPVDAPRGLFAVDAAPELGALDAVPSLVDGNTAVAVEPAIDVGATAIDANIGLDLGFARPIASLFLYTDRLADNTAQWSVYLSSDNLNWTLHTSGPGVRFNSALSRFEIDFFVVETRYVKVVKGPGQSVEGVLVTELQAFEALQGTREVDRESSSHLASSRLSWKATERLDLALDTSLRIEPDQGTIGGRNDYSYGVRGRFMQTPKVSQIVRWEQSFQDFERRSRDLSEWVAAYTLLYDPLPALSASASATSRATREAGDRTQEIHSALIEANGSPWSTLSLSMEGVVSRSNDLLTGVQTDTWAVRTTSDAQLSRRLGILFNWSHQEFDTEPERRKLVRQIFGAGGNVQITDAIYARATLNWIEDERFSRSQRYLLSWRLGSRLTVASQAVLDEGSDAFRSNRWSANAVLELATNASAYLTYLNSDLSSGEGRRIESWQTGMRLSF